MDSVQYLDSVHSVTVRRLSGRIPGPMIDRVARILQGSVSGKLAEHLRRRHEKNPCSPADGLALLADGATQAGRENIPVELLRSRW